MTELAVHPADWDAVVADADGPQLVVAGPGAGKTEFLVRRARHLVVDRDVPPEQVLLLAFSRRAAAELRSRVLAGLERSLTVVPAFTFHGLAMRVVEAHGSSGDWRSVPTLLTGPEQVTLVANMLASEDPAAWPQPFRSMLAARAFAAEVADFLLRAAERLVGPAELTALGRADWRALPGFVERYRSELLARGRIDYGSLQVEALRLLDDPEVGAEVAGGFRYVLVDEYQDTTIAQAAMVERLAGGHRNVTVAGDPYQSVYSFRGAELSNVASFPGRFRDAEGRSARRLVLTTSFRVPRRILEAAVRVTTGSGLPGAAGPVIPARGEGSVETYGFDQHSHEAEWIAGELQRVHLRESIPYRRMAVLVRSKRGFLPELSRALDRRRIPHDPPDARLVDHPAVRPVLDCVIAATSTEPERSTAIRRVLLGPLIGLTLSAARDLERKAGGREWHELLADAGPAAGEVGSLVGDPSWATGLPAADGFWHLWTSLSHFRRVATDSDLADRRLALTALAQALDRLHERDPAASLADYVRMAAAEDFEAEPLLEYRSPDVDRVTLTTLHQAKGLEFDVVFVADAREGVLPDLRTRDSLLGVRHLSPSHGADDAAYRRFRLQEEMRLAYTAICRARLRVVVTCTYTGPDGGAPSRILPLVAGASLEDATRSPAQGHHPTTPLEAEAWLRRRLRDPSLPATSRLAALATLTGETPRLPRHPASFAGALPRGPDTGLVEPDASLSPSQADSYLTCPRRYVFERRLRVDSGGSVYQELGSLLHDVLEEVERAAADAGLDHARLDDARKSLESRFDGAAFGGEPWATAWRNRAERILTHLYQNWPGQGPGIGFEEPVEWSIEGTQWTGRVDRIERRPGGLHVVDYKTGSSALTNAEAASSIQLGFYSLAAGSGQEPIVGAEFWFPGHGLDRAKSVAVREFDPANLGAATESMLAAQRGILAEDWTPVPGDHCDRCPVRGVCPAWPEGREAYLW